MKRNQLIKEQAQSFVRVYLVLIWCLCGIFTGASAQNLHLLVFADTDDPGLSAPNLMNISFLTEMANDVCQATGLKNRMVVYKGKDFLAKRCDEVLAGLKPDANDVVFFYFMGHGWNNSETEEPMLLFKTQGQSPGTANSRNLKAIFELLQRKGNRLTLVFGESCNSAINDRTKAKGHTNRIMNVSAIRAEQLKNLFIQTQAAVMLHTCKRGQKSNSSEDGGWFFMSFYDEFKQVTAKPYRQQPAEWQALLAASAKSTSEYAREQGAVQEPVFHYYAKNTGSAPGNNVAAMASSAIETKPAAATPKPPSQPTVTPADHPVKTGLTVAITNTENSGELGNVCAINRVAFKTLESHLAFFVSFRNRVRTMDRDAAADEFRKYYSTDRQEFFKMATQKLNVSALAPAQVEWFTKTCDETTEYLEDTVYYLNDPQFCNNAYSKLAVPIDNLRDTIKRVQDLLRFCRE